MDLTLLNVLSAQVTQLSLLKAGLFFSSSEEVFVLNITSFNPEATFKFQVTKPVLCNFAFKEEHRQSTHATYFQYRSMNSFKVFHQKRFQHSPNF